MLPNLESLRCFVAAATHPHFRSAARAVALSAPAFSDRIKQLEEHFQVQLFSRSTRRVALTDHGRRLLPQAARCLAEAARCEVAVRSTESLPYELTIGTRFELGMSWLVPVLSPLEAQRPERRLHLYFGDTADVLPRVLRQEVDCMVTSARITQPGLSFTPVAEEQYVFVGERRLLQRYPLEQPSSAAKHTLLDAHPDLPLFRYFQDARAAREVWAFGRVRHLGAIGAVRALVREGAGVGVLPRYYVAEDLKAQRLVPICVRTRLATDWFRLVWRTGHARDAELRALAADLAECPLR